MRSPVKGTTLKTKREALGFTQVQLAAILGVQPNTVARWENGVLAVPKVVVLAMETIERSFPKPAKTKRPEKRRGSQ
jgi:transcriptional regulator with XRE-family HTH domain